MPTMSHHRLLFVSKLAPDVAHDAILTIAKQARRNNALNGITGLLVFDSERFAQWMEGPSEQVLRVAEVMQDDPRHCEMEILYSAPTDQPRRFPAWRLGYLVVDLQESGLTSLRGQRGANAMESFAFMLPTLDPAIGEAIPDRLRKGWQ